MFFVDQTVEAICRDAATGGIHEVKPRATNARLTEIPVDRECEGIVHLEIYR